MTTDGTAKETRTGMGINGDIALGLGRDFIGKATGAGAALSSFSKAAESWMSPASFEDPMKSLESKSAVPLIPSTEMPDLRSGWHKLVIIGNGFDLECGLPSGFGKFIEDRRSFFEDGGASIGRELGYYTETIWDAILASYGDENWSNIEGAISKWVTSSKYVTGAGSTGVAQTCAEFNRKAYDAVQSDYPIKESKTTAYLRKSYSDSSSEMNEKRLLQISRDELTVLEKDFSRYLSDAVNACADYFNSASSLMKKMLRLELPSQKDYILSGSILSFIYTRPRWMYTLDGDPVSQVNVHGSLGDEIVFGIDGKDYMSNGDVLPFTKTYRLMALDLPGTSTLVEMPDAIGRGGTQIIKFYGHSLGPADYSYFQSIFDAVDLYAGGTKLIFLFRPYLVDGKMLSEGEARRNMMDKVIRLLTEYGETLDNKDHGKNLIHKLLLEGRLSVSLLD